MLELILPQLTEARQQQMGVFERLRSAALEHLSVLFGPGRPWLKFWSVTLSVVFLVLAFGRMPYRVEANAQLTTDSIRVLTAHNDGRLQEVLVDIGDLVVAGQAMSRMDTSDLRQQELEVRAELQRFQAEEDKARAANALADQEVARYRRGQSEARLQRVLQLLAQTDIKAPFDGVVVEGERRNLLGSSVRRGDTLFRVAQVKGLYLVLQLPERDIRDVELGSQGEVVLLSQPGKAIPFKVSNLVPMAQVKGDEGNHFLLKAEIATGVQAWWRPGMVGLARIDAGNRNIAWILFHRLVDTLRLWFWF
jgi:multidrug efflux pump subunit AcrA (membrane-fusion protein)